MAASFNYYTTDVLHSRGQFPGTTSSPSQCVIRNPLEKIFAAMLIEGGRITLKMMLTNGSAPNPTPSRKCAP
jgi:hypothetical protein